MIFLVYLSKVVRWHNVNVGARPELVTLPPLVCLFIVVMITMMMMLIVILT